MLKRSVVGLLMGLCVIGLGSRWAGAEEAGAFWEKTKVSGTVDSTYNYSLNRPTLNVAGGPIGGHLMEPRHNSFDINYAELAVETMPTEWATVRFDLGFGQDVPIVQSAGLAGGIADLQQGYIKVASDNGLSLTMGKFVTMHGAEVIERGANMNISHSVLFNYAIPFTHTGLLVGYNINDDWNIKAGIVNGWNNTTDNNAMKTLHTMLTGKLNDQWGLTIGGSAGPEAALQDGKNRILVDGTLTFDPNETWHFALNGDLGVDKAIATRKGLKDWAGAALYAHYKADAPWGATVRAEYYLEDAGATAITGSGVSTAALSGKAYEGTLTLHHYVTDGLEARLELRHDAVDRAVFPKKGTPLSKKYQDVAAVELVYTF